MGSFLEAYFKIIGVRDCPLYSEGEEFHLSGLGLHPPANKPACLFLAREVTAMVVEKMETDAHGLREKKEKAEKKEFNCSGCTGLIKFAYVEEAKFYTPQMRMLAAAENRNQQSRSMGSFLSLMNTFSFFQTLDEESLKAIFSCLVMKNIKANEFILHRGQPGHYLYLMVSGRVAVLDEHNLTIALLGPGEIFGEMSLFSGQPVCASIKAVEPVKILTLAGKDLSQILVRHPFLQMAFTRLLVQRLADTNSSRRDKMTLAFSGQLSELTPAELFQMLNENSKTGVVEFELAGGPASVTFSDGEVVRARCRDLDGIEAFYALLGEQNGRFKFSSSISLEEMGAPPLAAFMKLLMDGLRKMDEEAEDPAALPS